MSDEEIRPIGIHLIHGRTIIDRVFDGNAVDTHSILDSSEHRSEMRMTHDVFLEVIQTDHTVVILRREREKHIKCRLRQAFLPYPIV